MNYKDVFAMRIFILTGEPRNSDAADAHDIKDHREDFLEREIKATLW